MYDSCRIIGHQQFEMAQKLYEGPTTPVGEGGVDFVHTFVKMPYLNVSDPITGVPLGRLCQAAMGDSFAAGTTDGPGQFDFTQGANSSNPFWHFIVGVLKKVSPEEKACQAPKGILLPTGSVKFRLTHIFVTSLLYRLYFNLCVSPKLSPAHNAGAI